MNSPALQEELEVLVERDRHMVITLNRPGTINALTTEMIRSIRQALEEALAEDRFRFILIQGAGGRGFCAGGDVKRLAKAVRENDFGPAEQFFREEYSLDLLIHRYPKPVIVIADGITMGGGLGLCAGADIVVATEQSLIAMPETGIGFFPDVGATGWMFLKCPKGYPEYLGLTGYELEGPECVRIGLANGLTKRARLQEMRKALVNYPGRLSSDRAAAAQDLKTYLTPFFEKEIPSSPETDAWVEGHFSGKVTMQEIMTSLSQCSSRDLRCGDSYRRLLECSPTSLVFTLGLLKRNKGRPLEEVFATEEKAAGFMIRHPDYFEGIRARLLEKDERPEWRPPTLEEVRSDELFTFLKTMDNPESTGRVAPAPRMQNSRKEID
jgi:enoyl-CoA hydratase/carnithine racemase